MRRRKGEQQWEWEYGEWEWGMGNREWERAARDLHMPNGADNERSAWHGRGNWVAKNEIINT